MSSPFNIHRVFSPLLVLVIGLACACGDDERPTQSAPDAGAIDAPVAADAMPPTSELEDVLASYGTLSTLAGLGEIREKSDNGWLDEYEGEPAIQAELSRPHMALADAQGTVFIADKDAHAIRAVSAGLITTIAGRSEPGDDGDGPGDADDMRLDSPNGIWLTDSSVYILDLGNDKVRRVRDNVMTTLFRIDGAGAGRGLWVADDESIAYVSAGSVLKRWTPDEGITTFATGFVSLGNFVVEDDGSLVVADRLGHFVYRVATDGTKTVIAGNGTLTGGASGDVATEVGLAEVRGVWPHPLGGYFLAAHAGGQIWYLDRLGDVHLFLDGDTLHSHTGDGEHFRTPGKKISEPRAVTIAPDGRMLITENDFGYIRVLSPAE